MAGELDVSVVIPARNAAATLGRCLDALAEQIGAPEFEVIVVDDASTDMTPDIARRHPLQPNVVTGTGQGSYSARNLGAAASRGRVLAFTDADCEPDPGWLAAGLAALEAGADLAGGHIVLTADAAVAAGGPAAYDLASYLQQEQFVAEQGFAATANLFVRRAAFDRLGGFDAELRSGGDVEFGQRARAAGLRLDYAAAAVVRHPARASYRELWRLHRRLGAGWAALARRGRRPPWWRERALLMPTLGMVVERLEELGTPVRRRRLLAAHLTVRAARVAGRLTARPSR